MASTANDDGNNAVCPCCSLFKQDGNKVRSFQRKAISYTSLLGANVTDILPIMDVYLTCSDYIILNFVFLE